MILVIRCLSAWYLSRAIFRTQWCASTTQFAYRKGLGSCDALLCVSHTLQSALESGKETRIMQIVSTHPLIGSTIWAFSKSSAPSRHYLLFCFAFVFVLFLGSFLNSCGCSTAKSKTPRQETYFYPLNSTEHWSQPSLTTRDRELVSVVEVRIEPGDLNPRPLTPQSVTLPTLPRAGRVAIKPITARYGGWLSE